jgi:hypothetical protein
LRPFFLSNQGPVMNDLLFTKDLLAILQKDNYYGNPKNILVALKKLKLTSIRPSNDIEQMLRGIVVHMIDQRGESEPFLTETFIYPEAVVKMLKEHGLPVPTTLQPAGTSVGDTSLDQSQVEQYFDIVCRNCGTVNDPLGNKYKTPIGRLIFTTYLETRKSLGIKTTAKYVFEHLGEYDSDKVITSVLDDAVTWRTDDGNEKITSKDTIAKFIVKFEREINALRIFD